MNRQQIIAWLQEGDVSIQYQTGRDLMGVEDNHLRERIATEGWGHAFLLQQQPNGHWGLRFYQPKWISTHYTLLDLRNLCFPLGHRAVHNTIEEVLLKGKSEDGGICLGPGTKQHSDVCVNGMFLNYASWFRTDETLLKSVADSILDERMPDGGFNCQTLGSGAKHSSLHSTISVLEGLAEFQKAGYTYRSVDVADALKSGTEFILMHRLFLSDRTGRIIDRNFLRMAYPCRWRYDILRAMDYFQYAGIAWDARMEEAMAWLIHKQNADGTWNMQAAHPGQVHLVMEQAGKPGRWNTLRMLRVKKHLGI